MNNNGDVVGILPIPMYADLIDIDTSAIRDYILNDKNACNTNTNGNLASKDYHLLEHECFKQLKDAFLDRCNYFCADVQKFKYDELFITSSWYNINSPGTSHHAHSHSNSIVSGVFYVDAPKKGGNLIMLRGPQQLAPSKHEHTPGPFSADFCPIEPEDNLLVLFPSYVMHCVDENKSDRDRISIAFNVFFRGEFGHGQSFTYLKV